MSLAAETPSAGPPTRTGRPVRVPTSGTRQISDFQPDAIAVEETPDPPLAYVSLYVLAALLAAVITWASLSHVDKIVTAPGKLVTTKPTIVVQPLETSVVRSIEVAAGDTVRAGQVLARLDPTFSESDVVQLRTRVEMLDARLERLGAELAGRPYAPGPDATSAELLESKLYLQRKASYDAQMRNLGEALAKAEAGLATTNLERPSLVQRIELMRKIEDMRGKLFELNSGSRLNLLLSINQRLELEASLARMTGTQGELKHAIEKARSERDAFAQDFRRQVLEETVKLRDERNTAVEQIKKANLRKDMVVLTAPEDAVVLDLAQRSIGSVLREAEPLMTLVPLDVPLEAEVQVEARDIGQLKTGQEVRIKFETFPFQRHGTAAGVVRVLSQDSFPAQGKAETAAGAPHYRARVTVSKAGLRNLPPNFHLTPGMTVTAEIKVGDRTIISYFLYPILRGLDESIREP